MSTVAVPESTVPSRGLGGTVGLRSLLRWFEPSRADVAHAIERVLQPARTIGHRRTGYPQLPVATRELVAETLGAIATALRDPAVPVSRDAVRGVLALIAAPTSPLYGPVPGRALLVAEAARATVCQPVS